MIRQTGAADVSLEAGLIHVNSLVLRGLEAEGVSNIESHNWRISRE